MWRFQSSQQNHWESPHSLLYQIYLKKAVINVTAISDCQPYPAQCTDTQSCTHCSSLLPHTPGCCSLYRSCHNLLPWPCAQDTENHRNIPHYNQDRLAHINSVSKGKATTRICNLSMKGVTWKFKYLNNSPSLIIWLNELHLHWTPERKNSIPLHLSLHKIGVLLTAIPSTLVGKTLLWLLSIKHPKYPAIFNIWYPVLYSPITINAVFYFRGLEMSYPPNISNISPLMSAVT